MVLTSRLMSLSLALVLALALAGCGQKGPLERPASSLELPDAGQGADMAPA